MKKYNIYPYKTDLSINKRNIKINNKIEVIEQIEIIIYIKQLYSILHQIN